MARAAGPTRPTRPTDPRLLTNPSHQHNRLLIYCHCCYFLIFPLLTYRCPRYIFFAQDGRRKEGVPEPEVVQKRPFIATLRINLATYVGRAFAYAGPTTWNSLPDSLKDTKGQFHQRMSVRQSAELISDLR